MRIRYPILGAAAPCLAAVSPFATAQSYTATQSLATANSGFFQSSGTSGSEAFSQTVLPQTDFGDGISGFTAASADLASGELKVATRLQTGGPNNGANQTLARASFADSFTHRANGDAFAFDDPATARFSFDFSSPFQPFFQDGDFLFGGVSLSLHVIILEAGALARDGNPFNESGAPVIGPGSVLGDNFMNEFVIDFTGNSSVLSANPFLFLEFAESDVTSPSIPGSIDFSFNIAGDFDFVMQLTADVNAFRPSGPFLGVVDFDDTLGVTYTAPDGVDEVASGSGVFPDTVPVPTPGAAALLALGIAACARRRTV